MSKHNDCFNTPGHVFQQLNDIFQFTLDAACDSTNIKCATGLMEDRGQDGLKENWGGYRVFCNPPFSKKGQWIDKAISEVEHGNCPVVVMVLPLNCMSADDFFHKVIGGGYMYEIVNRRVQFLDNITKEVVPGNNSGTVIVYFKKKIHSNPYRSESKACPTSVRLENLDNPKPRDPRGFEM